MALIYGVLAEPKIQTEEQLAACLASVQTLRLDGLVIIGGDDSNTTAAILAEYFLKHRVQTRVVGVPKTIDGDVKNPYVAISFGFDTACKIYSESIGNIARDALSAKKYYHFIKLMGCSASHVALECALATRPNLTLIGEELKQKKTTLIELTAIIADLVCERASLGKEYGVILIPEGIIEFIPEIGELIREINHLLNQDSHLPSEEIAQKLSSVNKTCFASLPQSIQQQLLMQRDDHGNVQASAIETERLLIELVSIELAKRKKKGEYIGRFSPVHHFFGYEGRSAFPSNFDCNYCYALGHVATLLIAEQKTGYMCAVFKLCSPPDQWEIFGVPLAFLLTMEVRGGREKPVIQKAFVDLSGPLFTEFCKNRDAYRIADAYHFPGSMQFFGDSRLTI